MALVYGFGGLRTDDGVLSFDPHLPPEWGSISFRLNRRDTRLVVTASAAHIRFEVTGEPIDVVVDGRTYRLGPAEPTVVALGVEPSVSPPQASR